jgi:hypothetical protein
MHPSVHSVPDGDLSSQRPELGMHDVVKSDHLYAELNTLREVWKRSIG